eukprot:719087-Pleurochrysis_carterae.AAC.1
MANGCQLRDLKIASPIAAFTRKKIHILDWASPQDPNTGFLIYFGSQNVNPVQHSIDVLDACQTIQLLYG